MTHLPADRSADPLHDWWTRLDDETRQEADTNVLRDGYVMAVRTVWEALRQQGLPLHEAEKLIHTRYEALAAHIQRTPPDPLDLPSLTARATAHPGRAAAIEAVWDGDTVHSWFVVLLAILEDPPGEAHLATIYERRDGPSPATPATETGQALAHHLGVPFHFASPDVPDDQAPRWRSRHIE
ncbi:hypothetical protein [Streptomyces tailanensis]|uniref:hypothetical protein n=1 Tax=Streptomyces tailanensis TaxID=2569858 RepID=UPI001FEB6D1C|nr:hypothetical protein [Streptomyces tailanensis]